MTLTAKQREKTARWLHLWRGELIEAVLDTLAPLWREESTEAQRDEAHSALLKWRLVEGLFFDKLGPTQQAALMGAADQLDDYVAGRTDITGAPCPELTDEQAQEKLRAARRKAASGGDET